MEIQVPLYYTLNRKNRDEKSVVTALQVFSITPINCVVVTQAADAELALEFTQDIIQAVSDKDSIDLAVFIAKESGQPVLVIGEFPSFEAVYEDGTQQEIKC